MVMNVQRSYTGREVRDLVLQFALLPLGLLIFAPFVFLLLALLALVAVSVRMVPNHSESAAGSDDAAAHGAAPAR